MMKERDAFTEWGRSEVRCERGLGNVTGRSAVAIMTAFGKFPCESESFLPISLRWKGQAQRV